MNAFPANKRTRWLLGLTAFLLLAALVVGAITRKQPSPATVPVIPMEGLDKEAAEKVKDARAALVKSPRSSSDWGYLGRVLVANQLYPDIALVCFQEAEKLATEEPRWPYFSARLMLGDLNKPEESRSKFERAVHLAEKSSEPTWVPRVWLAELLAARGQTEEAVHHFEKVSATEPNNPRVRYGLGLIAYSRGQWKQCRLHLEACLGSGEARKKACVQLAMVCERLGDKEAADNYAKLAARVPKDFDWRDPYYIECLSLAVRTRDRYQAVESLEAQGQFGKAADVLGFLLSEYPNDFRSYLMMGRIQAQMQQYSSAESYLIKARQMAPDTIQAHYLMSLVLFKKGEEVIAKNGDASKAKAMFEESAASARKALAIRKDYGYAHMALGLALKQLGRRADALAAFRHAVDCNPEYADNNLFLGELLAEEGDVPGARLYLEQARLLGNPNDPRPKAALDKLPAKSAPKAK